MNNSLNSFNFACAKIKLSEMFRVEAGLNNPEDRIIPLLPGKIYLARSQVEIVAKERMTHINDYCKKLIALKPLISHSDPVISFFKITDDDSLMHSDESVWINPKYKTESKAAMIISKPIKPEEYTVAKNYAAKTKNELSVKKGDKVYVIEKNMTGWWFVNCNRICSYCWKFNYSYYWQWRQWWW